jgi:hypothetical protein
MHIVRFGMSPVAKIYALVLSIFVFVSYCPILDAQSSATGSDDRQAIYAPIAGLKDFDQWELTIVNRLSKNVSSLVTVYSAEGDAFPPAHVSLEPSETRRLNIKSLVPAEDAHNSIGGISITYAGPPMGIGAQVTISGFHGFGNVDAPVFDDMMSFACRS